MMALWHTVFSILLVIGTVISDDSSEEREPRTFRKFKYYHRYPKVDTLCESLDCGNDTCRVVRQGIRYRPEAVCLSGDPAVDPAIDAICRSNGYTETVLFGQTSSPGSLIAHPCRRGRFPRCPRGSWCVADGQGGGVCCFGKPECGESLDQLFQSSLEYNGRTYLLSKFPSQNSEIAQATCEAQGGYLAEINDAAENTAIKNFLDSSDLDGNLGVLVSGTDVVTEDAFIFHFSGVEMTFFDWANLQPDNLGGAACIQLWEAQNFQWDDIPCDRGDLLYLCEIP